VRRHDPGQVGGGAGADDEDLDPAAWRLADEAHHPLGRPVRRRDRHLARDVHLAQDIDRSLHHRCIGV
jgi:hypothetical protein